MRFDLIYRVRGMRVDVFAASVDGEHTVYLGHAEHPELVRRLSYYVDFDDTTQEEIIEALGNIRRDIVNGIL